MAETLKQTITDAVLRRMAGEQSYRRGWTTSLMVTSSRSMKMNPAWRPACAARRTRVTLTLDEGVLDYDCDCPIGAERTLCKHCVAAALAWRQQVAGESKARSKAKPLTLAEAAKLLERESAASIWASRSNRAMYWESPDSAAGSTLIATSRFSCPESRRILKLSA